MGVVPEMTEQGIGHLQESWGREVRVIKQTITRRVKNGSSAHLLLQRPALEMDCSSKFRRFQGLQNPKMSTKWGVFGTKLTRLGNDGRIQRDFIWANDASTDKKYRTGPEKNLRKNRNYRNKRPTPSTSPISLSPQIRQHLSPTYSRSRLRTREKCKKKKREKKPPIIV